MRLKSQREGMRRGMTSKSLSTLLCGTRCTAIVAPGALHLRRFGRGCLHSKLQPGLVEECVNPLSVLTFESPASGIAMLVLFHGVRNISV